MGDEAAFLSEDEKTRLIDRYRNQPVPELAYGTVADFCDSSDHISRLAFIQGDLKDLQRPAALKGILAVLPPGSHLVEIGAGEPHVADLLSQLGFFVTVVDPYDGSGHGPTDFETYKTRYPSVRFIRNQFSDTLSDLKGFQVDCVYSISVLEHVPATALSQVFAGIDRFLRPGGHSFHLIDHVLSGAGADYHLRHLTDIVIQQGVLAGVAAGRSAASFVELLEQLRGDNETYYLSAEGHNRWRGATPYQEFPFRKVVSIHSCQRKRAAIETPDTAARGRFSTHETIRN
jgi:methyltransferase family protein